MTLQNCNLSLQIARNCITFAPKFIKMRWRLGLRPQTPLEELKTLPKTPLSQAGALPQTPLAGGANGAPPYPLAAEGKKSAEPEKVHCSKIRPFTKS